jgi:hypothetical protein
MSNPYTNGRTPMKPLNFWLVVGGTAYTAIVLGVATYSVRPPEHWPFCCAILRDMFCCAEMS